jgi:glycosyltransferase, family 1
MKKLIRITTVPTSMRTLLKGQLKFMKQYYEVIGVSSDGECFDEMLEEQGNIKGVKIEMTRRITLLKDLKALLLLIKLFRKERPFIVHTHTPKAGLLGMIAARIANVPNRLHTIAGLPLLVATGPKRKILNVTERITNSCATKVYPNSFKMMSIMESLHLADPKKMKVLCNGSTNGIDTFYFSSDNIPRNREEIRKSLNIGNDYFVFVFVGRVVKDKGINELAKAFKKIAGEYEKCILIVVGKFEPALDPILPDNEKFIREHPSIRYVGFQSDVRPYLKAADALVFPSYREGFPNVVMQAGAMGLPSIVSDINGCNEIIVESKNGTIIPPRDSDALYIAMKHFLDNKDEVKSFATNARSMITSRYEQKDVWKALLEEYQNLK